MTQGTPGSLTVSVAPENGFQCFVILCLLRPTQRVGMHICTLYVVWECAGEYKDDHQHASNSSELLTSPALVFWRLTSPMPLLFLGLGSGSRSRRARWLSLLRLRDSR